MNDTQRLIKAVIEAVELLYESVKQRKIREILENINLKSYEKLARI